MDLVASRPTAAHSYSITAVPVLLNPSVVTTSEALSVIPFPIAVPSEQYVLPTNTQHVPFPQSVATHLLLEVFIHIRSAQI